MTSGGNSFNDFCISLQAYLVERYCITVPPCPDIIWGNGVLQNIFGERRSRVSLDYTTDGATVQDELK